MSSRGLGCLAGWKVIEWWLGGIEQVKAPKTLPPPNFLSSLGGSLEMFYFLQEICFKAELHSDPCAGYWKEEGLFKGV